MLTCLTRWLFCAAVVVFLPSCVPLFDVALRNDTGSDITVVMPGGVPEEVHIERDGTFAVDILVARGGHVEQFSVITPTHRWHYSHYMGAFGHAPPSFRERRSFDATRVHARIDSHGRIYLLSSTDSPIGQPAGFPVDPQ